MNIYEKSIVVRAETQNMKYRNKGEIYQLVLEYCIVAVGDLGTNGIAKIMKKVGTTHKILKPILDRTEVYCIIHVFPDYLRTPSCMSAGMNRSLPGLAL
jgi:hypothetical protein